MMILKEFRIMYQLKSRIGAVIFRLFHYQVWDLFFIWRLTVDLRVSYGWCLFGRMDIDVQSSAKAYPFSYIVCHSHTSSQGLPLLIPVSKLWLIVGSLCPIGGCFLGGVPVKLIGHSLVTSACEFFIFICIRVPVYKRSGAVVHTL
uniref:uncharacterized protein LOC122597344 n=1 Tax=Erigeron canadensis TaxID=72917 RepID=UPI001CB8A093|nr:uncharacterized protein LOC122597344 [Erigeron canadensis]